MRERRKKIVVVLGGSGTVLFISEYFFSFSVFLGIVPQGGSITSYGDHSLVLKSSNGIIRGNIVEGVEGGTFTALCIADSSLLKQAPVSMKWLPVRKHMKDQQIPQKREGNYTVKFTIAKLNRSDAGIYKCVMVMADNEAKEKQLELHVKPEGWCVADQICS